MKKLNKMVLKKVNVMTASQMKHITGGWGTCAYKNPEGKIHCNMSKDEALFMYYGNPPGSGANWCCDSCGSTWGGACN